MFLLSLPRDALHRIFSKEDVAGRCALACTCKTFRELSVTADLWTSIDLDISKLQTKGSSGIAAMLHFLSKRISHNTRLSLKCSSPQQGQYSGASDQQSDWPRMCIVPLLMGVGINLGLTRLELDMVHLGLALQNDILGILPWIKDLQELKIVGLLLADSCQLNALSKLSLLERLDLEFDPKASLLLRQSLQGGFPDKLAKLKRLERLSIKRAGYLGSLPKEISGLTRLKELVLSHGAVLAGLPASFAKLEALTTVRIEHFGDSKLAGLAWLPGLQELHLTSSRVPVELAGCSKLTALTLLLGNLPEHQIEQGFSLMLGYSQPGESLGQLLPKRGRENGSLNMQLKFLHISDTKLSSVPQAVTQLPNLERLLLTNCSLFDLPKGPYIAKLKTMGLKKNFFIEIPQSLAASANKLEKLDLSHNLLRPSEADVATVLGLPSLQHLWVTKTAPPLGPEQFRQNLNSWTGYSMQCLFKLATRHAAKYLAHPLSIYVFEASPPVL